MYDAIKDEMNSMLNNGVWNLVELPNKAKAIGCKWAFKIKRDSLGNIERYKTRLIVEGFTQKQGIYYTKTFSTVSKKDFLHIILALVAHFDLELLLEIFQEEIRKQYLLNREQKHILKEKTEKLIF